MDKKLITIKEAAESLDLSPATIRRRIKIGQLKAEKIEGIYGPQWVIDPDNLTESSYNIEVIPVRHNLTPDKLEDIIKRATQEAIRAEINESMQDYAAQMQELKNTIEQLQKQLNEQPKESFLKRLFKG